MSGVLPIVSIVRHEEITWNPLGEHASAADLQCGERNACWLGPDLNGVAFTKVITCALRRLVQTSERGGLGDPAEIDHDLVQRDYGRYGGLRTHEIHERRRLLRDRCPERKASYLDRPHIGLRLNAKARRFFTFVTESSSIFGFDRDRSDPAIRPWNDAADVEDRSHRSWRAPGHGNANCRRSVLKHSRTT